MICEKRWPNENHWRKATYEQLLAVCMEQQEEINDHHLTAPHIELACMILVAAADEKDPERREKLTAEAVRLARETLEKARLVRERWSAGSH